MNIDDDGSQMLRKTIEHLPKPPDWPEMTPVDLEEMRVSISSSMNEILAKMEPGVYVFNHPTGAGKTTLVMQAINKLVLDGWPQRPDESPIRVLYLTKTHKAIAEFHPLIPTSFRQRGRSDEAESESYCERIPAINKAAKNGHNAATKVCGPCLSNHRKVDPNWSCLFHAHVEAGKGANVVMACYDAFFNEGGRMKDFDIIIVDEDLLGRLYKIIKIKEQDITTWIKALFKLKNYTGAGLTNYSKNHPVYKLLNALLSIMRERNTPFDIEFEEFKIECEEYFKSIKELLSNKLGDDFNLGLVNQKALC
jgi:hypothetical protein